MRDKQPLKAVWFSALLLAVMMATISHGGPAMAKRIPPRNLPIDHDSGVPRAVSDEISGIFQAATEELIKLLEAPLDTENGGERFRRGRAARQLAQINRIRARFNRNIRTPIEASVLDSYRLGLRQGTAQLIETGIKESELAGLTRPSFDLIQSRSVEVAARDIRAAMNLALGDVAKDTTRLLRAISASDLDDVTVTRALAKSLITGNPAQAKREVREMFRQPGEQESFRKLGNRIITVGRANMNVRQYSNMLVRTRTREIVTTAKKESWLARGQNLAIVTGKVSRYFCTRYLALIVNLDGVSNEWPALSGLPSGGPPFHPNCSKGLRPFIAHLAKGDTVPNAKRALQIAESIGLTSRENLKEGEQAAARKRL